MVQKKKIRNSTSVKRKSPSASPSKKKLGEKSLDWITGTDEDKEVLSEEEKNSNNKSAGKSKEKKIGVLKQYVSKDAGKKKDETTEVAPAISGSSSTITKGERVMPMKEEEAQKTEVIETEEDKEKTISTEGPPVEIGKIYKITKEKETIIPEDSSSIVKKRRETASQEEIIRGEDKTPSEKIKTNPPAAKEEMPSSAKIKKMKISGICKSLKKESQEVSGSIGKTVRSDKTKVRKSVSSVINVSKQPVKAISAIDRKITQFMKKADLFSNLGDAGKSILKNVRSTDTKITKSAKKLMDSILD